LTIEKLLYFGIMSNCCLPLQQSRQKAESVNEKLQDEKRELEAILAKGAGAVQEVEAKAKKVEAEKKELDRQASVSATAP
jgi:hypothetical protein